MRLCAALLLASWMLPAQTETEWLNRGVQAFKSANYGEAVEAFGRAVELNPGSVTARLYLGTAHMQQYIPGSEAAEVTIHAVQGAALPATIKSVAGASRRNDFFGWDSTRTFDVSLQITGATGNLHPGLTTEVRVTADPIKGARYLPRQALFEQDGKPVVFVRRGRSFEPRPVKISDRTEAHIVVTDLPVGTEVALRNPLSERTKDNASGGPVQPRSGS